MTNICVSKAEQMVIVLLGGMELRNLREYEWVGYAILAAIKQNAVLISFNKCYNYSTLS